MSINERIIQAVTPVVAVCVPGIYIPNVGEEQTIFCTFNCTEAPDSFGDGEPGAMRYFCQVHLNAPWKTPAGESNNTLALRKDLQQSIFAAGFSYPRVIDTGDSEYQRFTFEFEGFDGEV